MVRYQILFVLIPAQAVQHLVDPLFPLYPALEANTETADQGLMPAFPVSAQAVQDALDSLFPGAA